MPYQRSDDAHLLRGDRARERELRHPDSAGRGAQLAAGRLGDPRDGRPPMERAELRQDAELGWQLGEARSGREGPFYGVGPRGFTRSDERIREEVCELLMRQGYIDPSRILVSVKQAEVILEGEVDSRRDKHELERMVEGVLAVRDIDNRLRVKRTS